MAVIVASLAVGCGTQQTPTAALAPTATAQAAPTVVPNTAVVAQTEEPEPTTIPAPTPVLTPTSLITPAVTKPAADPVLPLPIAEIVYGGTVQGEIDTAGGRDVYSFQASAGDQVTLMLDHDGNPGDLWVFAPDGSEVAHKDFCCFPASGLENIELEQDGEYLVLVDADVLTTFAYTLYLGPNLLPEEKIPVAAFGQSVEGEISPAGDEDTFTFQASAGDQVTLMLDHDGNPGDLWVFAPDGNEVAHKDFCCFPASGLENIELEQDGEYLVLVDADVLTTFAYTLFLGPNLLPQEEIPVAAFGQSVEGEISPAGDEDTFTFQASAGDQVTLMLDHDGNPGDIWVFAPDGSEVAHKDFCCFPASGLENIELEQDGEYLIVVDADVLTTFAYTLYLGPNLLPQEEIPVAAFGQSVEGEISPAGDEDTFTFQASAGDQVTLLLDHDGNPGDLWVFAPDGSEVAHKDFCCFPASGLENIELEQDGEYLVLVDADVITTFAYTLYLGPNLLPEEKIPVAAFGQSVEGEISPAGDEDTFTFQASAGDQVTLMLDHDGNPGDLWVFAPDGSEVAHKDFCCFLASSLENIELEQDGEYLIVVDADVLTTFAYTLTLQLS